MFTISRNNTEERSLEYINENCIACGICSNTCPLSAIEMTDDNLISIDSDECSLCGICSSSCAFDALKFTINDTDIKELANYPKWNIGVDFDLDDCLYCQKCEIACPQEALTVTRVLPERSNLLRGRIDIKHENCVYCGICEELCPADAITVNRSNFLNRSDDDIFIDETKCLYCKVCEAACPHDALDIRCSGCMDKEDMEPFEITGEVILEDGLCVKCGWCEDICPRDCVTVRKPFEGTISYDEEVVCDGSDCKDCIDICPCNAISIEDNKTFIDEDHCVLCGACELICQNNRIKVERTGTSIVNVVSPSWDNQLSKIVKQHSK